VRDDARCVLLHQVVQSGLPSAVSLVVDRGAIGRPLGLPEIGLHARFPKWRARTVLSRALRLNRPECCLPMCALRCGASFGCLYVGSTGSLEAAKSG
jgi:hypothetical protein